MNIEVIAIGTEILSGITTNTNATYISRALIEEGLFVTRHSVLPDDPKQLQQGLEEAVARNQLIICTGGLGPTVDDITKDIVAELFHSDFVYSEEIADDLKKRYGSHFPTIESQATVPTKAIVLKNSAGTAPGFIFSSDKTTMILLPGIPEEMKTMLSTQALPYLRNNLKISKRLYTKKMYLFNVSESTVDPYLREFEKEFPHINLGIYPAQGILAVYLTTSASNSDEAFKELEEPYNTLEKQFSNNLYDAPNGRLEEAVQLHFTQNKLTLSAAESCTGGRFSSRLTLLPGTSQFFLGSIVAYSNALKKDLLNIPESMIQTHGAVSSEVVTKMWQGIIERTHSDYAVAVTGIAGPTGGNLEKPVGTIWCAVGRRKTTPNVWKLHAYGNREMIIERSVNALLAELLKQVSKHES